MQANSLIKSTLMFNVLPGTEISVHAEFSHCRQNWHYGLQAMYSSMAVQKCGGSGGFPQIWSTPHCMPESGGQDPHTIAGTDGSKASRTQPVHSVKKWNRQIAWLINHQLNAGFDKFWSALNWLTDCHRGRKERYSIPQHELNCKLILH